MNAIKKHPVRTVAMIGGVVTAIAGYLSARGVIGEAEVALIGTVQTLIAGFVVAVAAKE